MIALVLINDGARSPDLHIVSGIYTIHRMRNMRFIYRNIVQIFMN